MLTTAARAIPIWVCKSLLFAAGLAPALYYGWQIWLSASGLPNALGADPAKTIVDGLGIWTLRWLLITLAVTPLRTISGVPGVIRYRRMCGLFAFFYASLHFLAYATFLLQWQLSDLAADVWERPYITVGFAALLLLLPLAATSSQKMIRLLKQNWRKLHRLVYLIVFLGLVHLLWISRSDITEVVVYSGIFAVLMLLRIPALRQQVRLA